MALPVTAPSPTRPPDAVRGHRAAAAGLPLTTAQAGLWRRAALDPCSPALNSAECIEIHGPLDPVVFAEALHRTVGETDALRIRVEETPHGPRQLALAIEAPGHGFPLQIASLLDQGDPDAVAGAWMRDDLRDAFDLGTGPLFRHALFQVGERRWLWCQRVHGLALDTFGHALVTRRAAEIYSALAAGEEAGDSPFGRLAGLVAEDAAYRTSEAYAADRAHWNRVLAGCPETPTLAGRRALPSRTFLRRTVWIGTDVTGRIEALAGAVRATWPEVLIAAQACYHARATRTTDVVLGLPMRGRMSPPALRVPGTVSHVLPLRLTLGPRATFADLTRQVVLGVRAARRHQRYPYEDLRRDLGLPGTAGRRPAGQRPALRQRTGLRRSPLRCAQSLRGPGRRPHRPRPRPGRRRRPAHRPRRQPRPLRRARARRPPGPVPRPPRPDRGHRPARPAPHRGRAPRTGTAARRSRRASGGVEGEKIARVRRGRVRSGRNRRTMCATAAPASPGAGR